MKIKVELWTYMAQELGEDFQHPSNMRSEIEMNVETGNTVRSLLSYLAGRYDAFEEKIFNLESGKLKSTMVMTLNDRVVSPPEIYDQALKDGDKITILPLHTGG